MDYLQIQVNGYQFEQIPLDDILSLAPTVASNFDDWSKRIMIETVSGLVTHDNTFIQFLDDKTKRIWTIPTVVLLHRIMEEHLWLSKRSDREPRLTHGELMGIFRKWSAVHHPTEKMNYETKVINTYPDKKGDNDNENDG